MNKNTFLYLWLLLLTLISIDCHKFNELSDKNSPSYIRVFNSLTYSYGPANKDAPAPFLVFLLDPVAGANGIYTNQATVIGDFIDPRDTFSNSYPSKAGNLAILRTKEWPGKANVLTAPSINGFDLSAWAQVSSGKHHVVFLSRPQSDTAYINLPNNSRTSVIVDTMVEFSAGEVYTLEAILLDEFNKKTGLYLRKENFTHTYFTSNNNYFSFYNLTARKLLPRTDITYFSDSLSLYYTEWNSFCFNTTTNGITNFNCSNNPDPNQDSVYFRGLNGLYQISSPFDSVPLPNFTNFLNPDSSIINARYQPYTQFQITTTGTTPTLGSFNLVCSNAYPNFPTTFISNPNYSFNRGSVNLLGQVVPSFNLITSDGIKNKVFSTVNIIELINDKVFLMQMSRLSNPPLIKLN